MMPVWATVLLVAVGVIGLLIIVAIVLVVLGLSSR